MQDGSKLKLVQMRIRWKKEWKKEKKKKLWRQSLLLLNYEYWSAMHSLSHTHIIGYYYFFFSRFIKLHLVAQIAQLHRRLFRILSLNFFFFHQIVCCCNFLNNNNIIFFILSLKHSFQYHFSTLKFRDIGQLHLYTSSIHDSMFVLHFNCWMNEFWKKNRTVLCSVWKDEIFLLMIKYSSRIEQIIEEKKNKNLDQEHSEQKQKEIKK